MSIAPAVSVEQRHVFVQTALRDLGYSDDLVRHEFPVFTRQGISRCDYAAFGESVPRDMTTATLVADIVQAEHQPDGLVARALAAPYRFAAAPTGLEIWNVASDASRDAVLDRLAYNSDGVEWPGRLVAALGPEPLLRAKQGTRQLSLLDIDVSLLPTARGQAAATLTERVEDSLAVLLRPQAGRPRLTLAAAARLVVGALTALMVRDKTTDAGEQIPSAGVLSDAGLLFPKQFSWFTDLSSEERTALEWLIESLGADVNYASLDPAVVSSVYEDAVVSKVARRQLGVHYTPFDLAKRIASALPFEKLEPNSRSVLDLACGSGTLLLAAHDRLQAIAPSELDAAARHNYVRSHITGFDVDEFAVQIARLSLLLHALPEGDGWHIEQRDALAPSHPALGQFSVVMTNPPWRQQRSVNSRRQERADAFVAAALSYAAPGGLIALILPATWLDSAASAKARLELTAKADVFEVWRLPEQTFGSASLAPCVILAERDGPRTGRTLFRRVLPRGGWRSRFFLEGLADEQHLTAKPRDGSGFLSGPVGRGTGLKLDAPTLSAVAHIQQGPVPEPPVDRVGAHGGAFRWLREAEDLPAYSGLPLEETIRVRYPEDFHRRIRDPSLFAAPKLLVSAKRWTNNPWRIKVGYDLAGVIPRETLYMIVPKQRDDTDLFWGLLAVLASSVASCWVDTYSPTLSIPRRVVASLPLPPAGELRALAEHGRTLAEATHQPVIDREILAALEGAVWDAYELDQATRARISAQLAGFRAPEGTARFDVEVGADLRDLGSGATGPASRRIGATLDSNDSGDVKLWIPGLTEPDGDWHPVPDRFFGWLAAPQSTFDVRVRGNDIHAATYAFQPKTYQSAEELAKIFSYSETDRDADDCESQFEDG